MKESGWAETCHRSVLQGSSTQWTAFVDLFRFRSTLVLDVVSCHCSCLMSVCSHRTTRHTEHWVLAVPCAPALRSTHFVVVSSCTIVQVKEKKHFVITRIANLTRAHCGGSPKVLISIVNWFWMINFCRNCPLAMLDKSIPFFTSLLAAMIIHQ